MRTPASRRSMLTGLLAMLLLAGCSSSNIFRLAEEGHPKAMESRLKRGGDPNQVDEHGLSLLYYAAKGGHKRTVRSLLDHGANPNVAAPETRDTPLHAAARSGHVQTATVLLDGGADPNARNVYGLTPRDEAIKNGHQDVADLFQ